MKGFDFSGYIIGSYWYSYMEPEVIYVVVYMDNRGVLFKEVRTNKLFLPRVSGLKSFYKTQDPNILKVSLPPLSSCTRDYLLDLVLDRWWDSSIHTRTKIEIRNILDFYLHKGNRND